MIIFDVGLPQLGNGSAVASTRSVGNLPTGSSFQILHYSHPNINNLLNS